MNKKIDLSFIQELKALNSPDDPQFFSKQCEIYIDYSTKLLAKCFAASGEHNSQQIIEYLHSFRGASANFGALALVKLCADLEPQVKILQDDQLREKIHEIDKEFQEFCLSLKTLMGE